MAAPMTDERLAELRERVDAWQRRSWSGDVGFEEAAELLVEVDRLRDLLTRCGECSALDPRRARGRHHHSSCALWEPA
jgi:hypothetical protein